MLWNLFFYRVLIAKLPTDAPMCRHAIIALLIIPLAGCAHGRIVSQSGSYYKDLSRLAQQEVIDNLEETITNPYRIPTRTTFGKGNLTSTDNGNASLAMPLHATSTNSGIATANIGSISDSYQIALVPEVDGVALGALREVYRAAVYPEKFKLAAQALSKIIDSKSRWIYWRNLDGTSSISDDPPGNAVPVGRGRYYEIWVTDQELFGRFILLTYGQTPASERATPTLSFVVPQTPTQKDVAPRQPGRVTRAPQATPKPPVAPSPKPPTHRAQEPILNIPPRIKPQFQLQIEEDLVKDLGGKAAPGPNEPALPAQIR